MLNWICLVLRFRAPDLFRTPLPPHRFGPGNVKANCQRYFSSGFSLTHLSAGKLGSVCEHRFPVAGMGGLGWVGGENLIWGAVVLQASGERG